MASGLVPKKEGVNKSIYSYFMSLSFQNKKKNKKKRKQDQNGHLLEHDSNQKNFKPRTQDQNFSNPEQDQNFFKPIICISCRSQITSLMAISYIYAF